MDVWVLSEVDAASADAFLVAASEGGDSSYAGLIGNTGGGDRLLIIYDEAVFELQDGFELADLALGGGRAPLIAEFVLTEDGTTLLIAANHFHRKSAAKRLEQSQGFRDWVAQQSLPLITAGDFNFDFDVPSGPGNAAFDEFLLANILKWEKPEALVATNWSDGNGDGENDFNSVLDFVFSGGGAQQWLCEAEIIVQSGDFPDDHTTSDHRPVLATIDTSPSAPLAMEATTVRPTLRIASSRPSHAAMIELPARHAHVRAAALQHSAIAGSTADVGTLDAADFGRFEGDVVARWSPDGREMELVEDFAFIDRHNRRWTAPQGSVVNGASIPRVFWSVMGGPFSGEFRAASVVHDVYCDQQSASWQDVHRMFYDACRCGGVGLVKAKTMYYAVYHFGPRWGEEVMMASVPRDAELSEAQVAALEAYVKWQNPSLDDLETLPPLVLQSEDRP